MTGSKDFLDSLSQGDHSWLFLTDLDDDQVDLLDSIWYVALVEDAKGAGLTWPSWRSVDQHFFEVRGDDAGEVFQEMPSYDMRGSLSSYGLIWRSEGRYASPSPRDDERVGLTVAGIVQLARHKRPNLEVFADDLVKVIQTLAQDRTRTRRESQRDVDRLLDDFVQWLEPARPDKAFVSPVESIGQVLQREGIGVVKAGDHWVVKLGGTRLRKYLTTESAGTYLRQVAETVSMPVYPYPGVEDVGEGGHQGTTVQIDLENAVWTIGDRLDADSGGFGQVFVASGPLHENAVAKFVKKEPGATRELLIGDFLSAQNSTNVVPILDSGEHDGQWVLVMPRAEMSLQQRLQQTEPVELAGSVRILSDIARAMASLDGQVVHRDLKPANVLFLDGKWCLADFGIARYAEATTATETRKYSWTLPFAAPEQWLLEHATPATDVYAFGVMAYLILEGRLPFTGPASEDFREQHLGQTPPAPTAGTARLRNIILECLHKAPEARPTAANILVRLEKVTVEPALGGAQKLALLNAEEVSRRAQAHVEQWAAEDERARRERLFSSASQMFESIVQPLLETIEDDAPTASLERNAGGNPLFLATLRGAKLGVTRPHEAPADGWGGPFTVIAHAAITVHRARQDRSGWLGRCHSLWYCDPKEAGRFGWYELAFMSSAFTRQGEVVPHSLPVESAAIAFSGVLGTEQLAWPVTEIDRDDPSEFIDRWLGWFADAIGGTLTMPTTLPDRDPGGSWRRR
jgi:hypothetical protein